MILTLSELTQSRPWWSGRVVAATGCFDILHAGHLRLLRSAKHYGDTLVVGLNSDSSVRQLKGPSRPINHQDYRAELLNSLRMVDYVVVFDGLRCDDFLRAAKPNTWVKGGDYTLETLDASEKEAAGQANIILLPHEVQISTTKILECSCS